MQQRSIRGIPRLLEVNDNITPFISIPYLCLISLTSKKTNNIQLILQEIKFMQGQKACHKYGNFFQGLMPLIFSVYVNMPIAQLNQT